MKAARRPFVVAAMVSVVIHVVILSRDVAVRLPEDPAPRPPLALRIAAPVVPAEPVPTVAPPSIEPAAVVRKALEPVAERDEQMRTGRSPVGESGSTPRQLVFDARAVAEADPALQVYDAPECSERDALTLVRKCPDPGSGVLWADLAPVLDRLFPEAETRQQVRNDMRRIDQLIAYAQDLSALEPGDPAQVSLVREQQRHIRDEIMRIDRQYQEFNLLKAIPMAAKVIRGLQDL